MQEIKYNYLVHVIDQTGLPIGLADRQETVHMFLILTFIVI